VNSTFRQIVIFLMLILGLTLQSFSLFPVNTNKLFILLGLQKYESFISWPVYD